MLKNLVFDFGNALVVSMIERQLREFTNSDEEAIELRTLIQACPD